MSDIQHGMRKLVTNEQMQVRMRRRVMLDQIARKAFLLTIIFALIVLGILVYQVVSQSIGWLDWDFLTGKLSIRAERAGIKSVIIGTCC